MPEEPARIRVKLIGFAVLAVSAVLTHMPAVVVVALVSTCATIPVAAGLHGGADLLRAVFLVRARR